MRIIVTIATIAVLAGNAIHPSLVSAEDRIIAGDDEQDILALATKFRTTHDAESSVSGIRGSGSAENEECNTFEGTSPASGEDGRETIADVGVLGCDGDRGDGEGGRNRTCLPDETSSVGGRCAAVAPPAPSSPSSGDETRRRPQRPREAAFRKRRNRRAILADRARRQSSPRLLQISNSFDVDDLCPGDCPLDFCDCAQSGSGDARECAPQLHDVCARELLSECVPDKYLPFYERTYCPFAECMLKTTASYESCECDYYKDYCELYYQFEESIGKCEVSTCCEGEGGDTKWKCLEAFNPTYNPTAAPTDSTTPPSGMPSVTSAPSTSTSPTVSTAPTVTSTNGPSGGPSVSSEPTASPTTAPTTRPTTSPTEVPSAPPSLLPSPLPSSEPSSKPSASVNPTVSFLPTLSPSTSMPPTATSAPSSVPTVSASPTIPPSLMPTSSFPPTPSPTTSAPTGNPTASPTVGPTGSPTESPTESPTGSPTRSPAASPKAGPVGSLTNAPATAGPTAVEPTAGDDAPDEGAGPASVVTRKSGASGRAGTAAAASLAAIGGFLWLLA